MSTQPSPFVVNGDTFTVPGTDTIEPLSASVLFDGSGAAGAFMPCLSFYAPTGELLSRTFPQTAVAAGASAEVSYIPFVPPSSTSGGTGTKVTWDLVLKASGTNPTGYSSTSAGYYIVSGKLFVGWIDLYFNDPAPSSGTGIYTLDVPPGLGPFDGTNPGPRADGRYAHTGGKSYIADLVPFGPSYTKWLIEFYDPTAVADTLVTSTAPWGGYVQGDLVFQGFIVAALI